MKMECLPAHLWMSLRQHLRSLFADHTLLMLTKVRRLLQGALSSLLLWLWQQWLHPTASSTHPPSQAAAVAAKTQAAYKEIAAASQQILSAVAAAVSMSEAAGTATTTATPPQLTAVAALSREQRQKMHTTAMTKAVYGMRAAVSKVSTTLTHLGRALCPARDQTCSVQSSTSSPYLR